MIFFLVFRQKHNNSQGVCKIKYLRSIMTASGVNNNNFSYCHFWKKSQMGQTAVHWWDSPDFSMKWTQIYWTLLDLVVKMCSVQQYENKQNYIYPDSIIFIASLLLFKHILWNEIESWIKSKEHKIRPRVQGWGFVHICSIQVHSPLSPDI